MWSEGDKKKTAHDTITAFFVASVKKKIEVGDGGKKPLGGEIYFCTKVILSQAHVLSSLRSHFFFFFCGLSPMLWEKAYLTRRVAISQLGIFFSFFSVKGEEWWASAALGNCRLSFAISSLSPSRMKMSALTHFFSCLCFVFF